ncbi:MAG TPA: SRPBCC domain-containing protein [Acidothermaceae bacterium]|jgi:uncharacterized protein YndB with AHSA1/START domain|nr:SRPBCC domain-containing protein [Acidothermaceae bacterium]
MSTNGPGSDHLQGSLRSEHGIGIVRIEQRVDIGIVDVWSALTDPGRISRWYGQVEGDLHVGGDFRLNVASSGWDGTGRVQACEPSSRLLVTTRESDESWQQGRGVEPFDVVLEATLAGNDDETALVMEVRGLPLKMIAFYGAGWQIHIEDLASYLRGGQPGNDIMARFDDLVPHYQDLAAVVS